MENQRSSKRRASVIRFTLLFLWIGVIFFLSSPEGSSYQTSRIIGPLLHFFIPNILPETEAVIHGFVRKCAHVTEYAVLAFLAIRAFSISALSVLRHKSFLFALLLVVLIASLDEINQSFEASRTSSFWDVLLDISGGLVMTASFWLFRRRFLSAAIS